MTKKEYCLTHDRVAYYSGVGGIEIHGKVKIHYDYNDNDYIVVCGYKVPLNECIRFGTMWG